MQIGSYWIEDEIGRGGAGAVYRARGPQGLVALKILGGQSQAAWARFQREVQLQAELTGEGGFVPVLDAGLSQRGPYLVMPFLPGGTLRGRLRSTPQGFPLTELVDLGEALASAIGRAHALGLVHRDLKPENVLFDHLGCPQIADLGLAKAMEASDPGSAGGLSKTGELRGTLGYMPPEQIADAKRASASSDVFALGAILYECATGRPAFSGQGALEVMDAIRAGRYADPRSLRPELPKPLEALIQRCLETDPQARPADGRALSQALATVGLAKPRQLGRGPAIALALLGGVVAAVIGYQVIRMARAPLAVPSPRPTPSSTPAPSPGPSTAPSSAPSPEPSAQPSAAPTPEPSQSPRPTPARPWAKTKGALAKRLDTLESIALIEELGQGLHRTATPIQNLFLAKDGSVLVAWGEEWLWTYTFPELRLRGSVRMGFASLAEMRNPECVRALSPDGDSFVMSTTKGAFLSARGKGLRVELPAPLRAATFLAPQRIAALASQKQVSLISTETREGRGTLIHKQPVVALASAPDTKLLLSATADGTVHLWEIGPTSTDNVHKGRVTLLPGTHLLALGPKGDLWAAGSEKHIRVQSFSGKVKPLNVNITEGEEPPTSIRFSADGQLLLVLSETLVNHVRIEDRKVTRRITIPRTTASVLDSSGDRLVYAAANSPHLIRSYHIPTEEAFKPRFGHVGAITTVAPAPEGVVGGDDAGGHSYWKRGQPRYVRLTPGPITGIAQLGGRTLVARRGSASTEVTLEDGKPTKSEGRTTFAAWGPRQTVAVGEENGLVRLIRSKGDVTRWRLHRGAVLGVRLLPKGLVSWGAGEDRLLVSQAGEVAATLDEIPPRDVVAVVPLRGNAIAVGLRSGSVKVFDARDGRLLTKIEAAKVQLTCLAGHRSGRLLLVGDRWSEVRVFHWKDGQLTLREEVTLGKVQDFLTYAGQGRSLDHLILGTARGVILRARWLPVKNR